MMLRRVDSAANRLSGRRRFAVSTGGAIIELLLAVVAHMLYRREDSVASGYLLKVYLGLGRSLLLVARGYSGACLVLGV